MERKIGEIFEYNSEWYQVVGNKERYSCVGCYFNPFITQKPCDGTLCGKSEDTIIKKLEKVGEPCEYFVQKRGIVMLQPYKMITRPYISGVIYEINYETNTIALEIKENKEDMEKKDKEIQLNDLVNKYLDNLIDNKEFEKGIKEWFKEHSNSEKIGKNLKEFDINLAKAGKPVCTRDGRKARIICFDKKNDYYPIIALVETDGKECIFQYTNGGEFLDGNENTRCSDLMMLSEKKEGWVNIYKDGPIYSTKEEAQRCVNKQRKYITTIKVEYEE